MHINTKTQLEHYDLNPILLSTLFVTVIMAPRGINPVESTYHQPFGGGGSTAQSIPHPPPISSKQSHIAGILVTVFGLNELPSSTTDVAALWLLHPRLQTQECMAPFAAHIISDYNNSPAGKKGKLGLIAVSFDQRNHGTRLVSRISNEAWRSGNENHALDMFSCYAGTAMDTSLLLDYLPGYIFPDSERRVTRNLVLGISLGGHAAWHVIMQDERFSAAVVTSKFGTRLCGGRGAGMLMCEQLDAQITPV
jgi:hypothetical protein